MTKYEPQSTDWNCALCPIENFPSFATAREMREHAAAVHELPLEQTERLLRRPVMFLDGDRGSAQQVYNWCLPDGRVFCSMVWGSGSFATSSEGEPAQAQAGAAPPLKRPARKTAAKGGPNG